MNNLWSRHVFYQVLSELNLILIDEFDQFLVQTVLDLNGM